MEYKYKVLIILLYLRWLLIFLCGVVFSVCTTSQDVNSKDTNGYTPLMIASSKGDYQKVESLLKRGANVNEHSYTPTVTLAAAVADCRQLNIQRGPNIRANLGQTALMLYIYEKCVSFVKSNPKFGAKLAITWGHETF